MTSVRPYSLAGPGRATLLWGALVLALAVAVAYWGVWSLGFVWDDDAFLTSNPLIRSPGGLWGFWCTSEAPDYWPLTSTTLWLEWRLWGAHAAGYHVTNALLHAGECFLLWRILLRLEVPGAFLAALLFAVHPVNVETVAWIAQRKNLMAMLFSLLSVEAFLRSGERGAWRWTSLGAFVLALLCKGSVATLPAVLALILWWQGRLTLRECARLVPFAAAAVALTLVNIWFQHHGDSQPFRDVSVLQRLLGAPAVVGFYLGKAVCPLSLSFIYPTWRIDPGSLRWWVPLASALAVTGLLVKSRASWARPLLIAWIYVCLALVPVMGFTDVYFMTYSLVADHYQHMALIGTVALAGAGLSLAALRWGRGVVTAVVAVLVALLAAKAHGLSETYRDSATLFEATVRTTPEAWMAHYNLGLLRAREHRLKEAESEFREALRTCASPYPDAALNLGTVLMEEGRLEDALPPLFQAVQFAPRNPTASYDLGLALARSVRLGEAISRLEAALALRPRYPEALNALGIALAQSGRLSEAEARFSEALEADPTLEEARRNRELVRQDLAAGSRAGGR